ncbi:MAG: hypothetical protein DRP42_04455 [Tenericutes bacterium]|nr:MAG: hypothetical protein DRP42_04455 [Mycoplasmatota bacterium]
MKDYMKLAAIVALFIAGSAVESHADNNYMNSIKAQYGQNTRPSAYGNQGSSYGNTGQKSNSVYGYRPNQNRGNNYNNNNSYRQQRNRDLSLQHGAGGCTPNFSTGGCL